MHAIPIATGGLADGWGQLWGAISSAFPNLANMMNLAGAAITVFAILKFFWERRKGTGGDMKIVWGSAMLAAVLTLPGIILPALLKLVDMLIAAGANVLPK